MKKTICLTMILSVMLGCCACNNSVDSDETNETDTSVTLNASDLSTQVIELLNTLPSDNMSEEDFVKQLGYDVQISYYDIDYCTGNIVYEFIDSEELSHYCITGFSLEKQMDGRNIIKAFPYENVDVNNYAYQISNSPIPIESIYRYSFDSVKVVLSISEYDKAVEIYESLLSWVNANYSNVVDERSGITWVANGDNSISVADPVNTLFNNNHSLIDQCRDYLITDENNNMIFVWNPRPELLKMTLIGDSYEIVVTNYRRTGYSF